MELYNYIVIIIIIITLYIITYENYESCKITRCSPTYTVSKNGKKCCINKANATAYDDNCNILSCGINYTLSDGVTGFNTDGTPNINDGTKTCCKNVFGDNITSYYNSNSTYDNSCNIKKCGVGIQAGNLCCINIPGVSTFNSDCKPLTCNNNYILSKSNEFCCLNNDVNALEYTSSGTSCTLSKCKDNYYVNGQSCAYCKPNEYFIPKDGKSCKKKVVGALTYFDNGDVATCDKNYVRYNETTCNCDFTFPTDLDQINDMIINSFKIAFPNLTITKYDIFNTVLYQGGGDTTTYRSDIRFVEGLKNIDLIHKINNDCTRSISATSMNNWVPSNNTDPTKMYNVIPNEYKYIKIKMGNDYWGYLDGGYTPDKGITYQIYLNKNYVIPSTYTNNFIRWRYINYHIMNDNNNLCISITSDGKIILEKYVQDSPNQIFYLYDYVPIISLVGSLPDPYGNKSFVIQHKNGQYIYTNSTFKLLLSNTCTTSTTMIQTCTNTSIIDFYHWYQE